MPASTLQRRAEAPVTPDPSNVHILEWDAVLRRERMNGTARRGPLRHATRGVAFRPHRHPRMVRCSESRRTRPMSTHTAIPRCSATHCALRIYSEVRASSSRRLLAVDRGDKPLTAART